MLFFTPISVLRNMRPTSVKRSGLVPFATPIPVSVTLPHFANA